MSAGPPTVRLAGTYSGPSIFCRLPSLRLAVPPPLGARQLGPAEAAGIRAALAAGGLPTVASAGPAVALIGEIAVALQCRVGHPVAAFALPPPGDGATGEVVYEFRMIEVGLGAGQAAAEIVAAGLSQGAGGQADSAARIRALVDPFLRRHAAGGLPGYLAAAEARGIPWRQAIAGQPFYLLGHGCRQRRLWRHYTPATSHIGTLIATHKHLTTTLFRANAIPAPRNIVVADADAAVRAARSLGPPVVVKPAQTDFGTAVSVNLSNDADIRRAFEAAGKHGQVLVEELVPGDNFRLLVMYGRFVSAVRQTPARVVGDGIHRIRELVERVNRTRSAGLSENWKKIPLDAETDQILHRQGLRLEDAPPAGAIVHLRHQSNLSTGGTMENVTAEVHPDNRHLAVRAAALAGLDVAGIDFITPDIARSYREAGGAI
jgi:cyanophycin synthetase